MFRSCPLRSRVPGSVRRSWSIVALVAGCAVDHAPGAVAQGGACTYDTDCAPVEGGAYCQCAVGSSGPYGPVCQAFFPEPCGDVRCTDVETCFITDAGTGMCVPMSALGEPCVGNPCRAGLFCNAALVCEAAHRVGQPCSPEDPTTCAAPAFCNAETATCDAPRAPGEPCDFDEIDQSQCAAPALCSPGGVCTTPQPNGAACHDGTGCLSHFCSPSGTCETPSCVHYHPEQ